MKVVRLDELTPDMRCLVLTLIDAAKAAKPEAVPASPDKRMGTASDKEKVHG
jgi:hypothetical protein